MKSIQFTQNANALPCHGLLYLKIHTFMCILFILTYDLYYLPTFWQLFWPFLILFHKGQAFYLDYQAIYLQEMPYEEEIDVNLR